MRRRAVRHRAIAANAMSITSATGECVQHVVVRRADDRDEDEHRVCEGEHLEDPVADQHGADDADHQGICEVHRGHRGERVEPPGEVAAVQVDAADERQGVDEALVRHHPRRGHREDDEHREGDAVRDEEGVPDEWVRPPSAPVQPDEERRGDRQVRPHVELVQELRDVEVVEQPALDVRLEEEPVRLLEVDHVERVVERVRRVADDECSRSLIGQQGEGEEEDLQRPAPAPHEADQAGARGGVRDHGWRAGGGVIGRLRVGSARWSAQGKTKLTPDRSGSKPNSAEFMTTNSPESVLTFSCKLHPGAGGRDRYHSPACHRGVAQLGSALRSGRRGPRFESGHPDASRPGPPSGGPGRRRRGNAVRRSAWLSQQRIGRPNGEAVALASHSAPSWAGPLGSGRRRRRRVRACDGAGSRRAV